MTDPGQLIEPSGGASDGGRDDTAAVRGIEIAQTILTALILAFVFRAFFVEAFIIPTGSMAEGLLGEHGRMVCPSCGWDFPYGPEPHNGGNLFVQPAIVTCPNCGHQIDPSTVSNTQRAGDRIIVHKWPYAIGGPFGVRRWDVIVFRDPADPQSNYIKRVVGLPKESIEIVDGDVYIAQDGQPAHIARKTPAAQEVLWSIVLDQNYRPTATSDEAAHPSWQPDSRSSSGWSGLDTRVLRYAPTGSAGAIRFVPRDGRESIYDVSEYNHRPPENPVRDLRVRAELTLAHSNPNATFAIELQCDDTRFRATYAATGEVRLEMQRELGQPTTIGRARSERLLATVPVAVELSQVDYRATVRVAGVELIRTEDAQYAPPADPPARASSGVRMIGDGVPLILRNVRIDRDVYYTQSYRSRRAMAGEPFHLNANEYFVLGDNSANSHDSREWFKAGPHLRERDPPYRLGTVPADQIVGRAFFVYLPSMIPSGNGAGIRVPDLGRVRFVR